MRLLSKLIQSLALALPVAVFPALTDARPVWVEDGSGNGFLFRNRGVCYVILPTHVHGRGAFRLSARNPSGLGTGRIIHKADAALDLSLGVVSGTLEKDCGQDWADLPQRVAPVVGQTVTAVRYEQGSVETIRSMITTVTFTHLEIAPLPDETRFFAARTSGAFVLDGTRPLGMIVEAEDRQSGYVLRWDEIYDRLRRVVEDWYEEDGCTDPAGCDNPVPDPAPATLSGFRLASWKPHGISGEHGAEAMVAGLGPYVAPISRTEPVILTFEADTIREVSRVVLRSDADNETSVSPKLVMVRVDTSSDGVERWRDFRSPQDMVPGEALDLRRGATHARRLRIEIRSGWGDGPVRLDSVAIE
ncbi:hypothetical protein [Paracoccus salsus]|uniref:hypothetical protein n=1 Tax=Paracoccus salsus TaxID=2911061 RepID=UPI001F158CEF|nr:hypothetical protein [Paracoccus salsus]MCF3972592.1 hypothetical protein [Paracoccus salsus]